MKWNLGKFLLLFLLIEAGCSQQNFTAKENYHEFNYSPYESFITLFPSFFLQNITELKSYIRSSEFSDFKKREGDLAAVDEIYNHAFNLTRGNTGIALLISTFATFDHFTVDLRVPILKIKIPLTNETKEEFEERLNSLPSKLYKDSPKGYGDRDKLQHFFGSAFLTYVFENKAAADRYSEFVEVFEDNYIYSVGFDVRDIAANRDGQRFGYGLSKYYRTKPSDILKNKSAK
jgi:hypothetical protein